MLDLSYLQAGLGPIMTDWANSPNKLGFNGLGQVDLSGLSKQTSELAQQSLSSMAKSSDVFSKLGDSKIISDITEKNLAKARGFDVGKAGQIAGYAGMAADLIGGFMPTKTEYAGARGNITSSMDSAYDTISDVAMQLGPWGQLVGGIMKGGALLGKGLNSLGGGTDGMTTTDAILGSSFLNLTPIGMINGFGGKKADTITKDEEAFEAVGSSYGGTSATVDDALQKSGKKYGAFSSGARKEANREIAEARRQQDIMAHIASNATDRFNIRNSMSSFNSNAYGLQLQGGYNQSAVRVGRHGLSTNTILTAKRVVSAMRFRSKPVEQFQPEVVDSFQQGGVLERSLQDISEEYLEPMSTIEEVTLDSILPEFREGGKVNVIPEGALHARLHHMENADNLTKKGIPVVSEKDGGELEQQAEIEREEIIFRLEVTKKLEELSKKYSDSESSQKNRDEAAIEAGKLLVEEILNNTIDNTGLLTNIN